jgi:hypothetical protein
MKKSKKFLSDKLRLVAKAEDFHDTHEPPLRIGDVVCLNSGGPLSLVVDICQDSIIIAWQSGGQVWEYELAAVCVHRVCIV